MPVFRNGTRQPAQVTALTRRLADELTREQPIGQPVVYENRIGQSPRYSVTVIWDAWDGMDRVARSRVILDAYELADPSKTGQISIAVGLTTADAVSMGILPFAVVPHVEHKDDIVQREAVKDILRQEPGVVSGVHGLELRFRTLSEASEAVRRLESALPTVLWIVVHNLDAHSNGDDGI